jgi:hypothetical protein
MMADDELKLDPQNVRAHPPRNVEMVRQSLEESGPFRGIGVDGDNIIRAGNLTYQQAIDLGYTVRVVEAGPKELIAVKRPDLRGREAERAALWDNASGDQAEWDAVALAELQKRDAVLLEGVLGREELHDLGIGLESIVFPEYDESIADEVEYLECPECGYRWPK